MSTNYAILTFSHLRWDFVFQRPQHLLSRMASSFGHEVIFIEEPVFTPGDPYLDVKEAAPGVLVCKPHTAERTEGFNAGQLPLIEALVTDFLREHGSLKYCAWLYTPMASPLLRSLDPIAVVYDCMDELSAFLGSPPEMIVREAELLAGADIVFTGGPSLYQSKRHKHSNAHCFPSSVDAEHFRRALDSITEPDDQKLIPHPRLGYFGVVDERIDADLLAHIAQARPDWQIVVVGPVVKINPASLPDFPNIHYLGQKRYEELPAYLAGWDVALLPFALNDATRFISPTKTLEYMAAEKMIVSTPIADVVGPYSGMVFIGRGPEEFLSQCDAALHCTGEERERRLGHMRAVLANTSWDRTVERMHSVLNEASERKTLSKVAPLTTTKSAPVVVVGAGPTGLSAAYHLGSDSVLIEQNSAVGGWCRSVVDNGFTFDHAGHIMFSNDPYVHEMYRMLLGDNVHWQDREAWIYSKDVYTRYPFQGSLYGLPPEVIKECILGAVEARFGPLKASQPASDSGNGAKAGANGSPAVNGKSKNGKPVNGNGVSHCKSEAVNDCCADGVLESTAELRKTHLEGRSSGEPRNFEEFIYKVWGSGIAKHFAIPYNKKLWAVPLTEMETSWLGGRVPMPDLEEMIDGALRPSTKPMGPNARFGYPLRGGFQALMNGFLPHLKGDLWLSTRVARVSPIDKKLVLTNGAEVSYEYLISTMPLPALVRSMGDEAPPEIQEAAAQLRFVSVRCVNIGVGRADLTDKHWIYYPEDTVFHRIFVQGNASPYCNAPGGLGLTCEITYSEHKPLPCDGDALIERCIEDCHKVGMFNPEDPIWAANQVDLPYAYVVYDHARPRLVSLIRDWMSKHDVLLAGRYSEWEYYNSDHAFLAGKKAAERVRELQAERETKRPPLKLVEPSVSCAV